MSNVAKPASAANVSLFEGARFGEDRGAWVEPGRASNRASKLSRVVGVLGVFDVSKFASRWSLQCAEHQECLNSLCSPRSLERPQEGLSRVSEVGGVVSAGTPP